jgi:two-component system sensor histidine kinase RegB
MSLALDMTPSGVANSTVKGARAAPQAAATTVVEAHRQRRPRLRTLILMRWIAVAGQAAVLLTVHFGLGFQTPLVPALVVIGVSVWLNVGLTLTRPMQAMASDLDTTLQISFDIIQASVLLGMTGGMNNPFVILLIGPVAVGAAALPLRPAAFISVLGLSCATALKYFHWPLPWSTPAGLDLPYAYEVGMWAATVLGMTFTAGYAWTASRESARMELALATTQHVLAREQRLGALGALAASAAHELGTPLATIQVVAKEMHRSLPADDPNAEDARLLLSQAERCRDILKRLSRDPGQEDPVAGSATLLHLLEEAVEPHRAVGPAVTTSVRAVDGSPEPVLARSPEVVHALSSLVENAADFARAEVVVLGVHDRERITVEIADDGPGFAPAILAKLGEPYVTSRPHGENSRTGHLGMGLGFFIAKTLLERTGAEVKFRNGRRGGAVVCVIWPRDALAPPVTPMGTGVEPQA